MGDASRREIVIVGGGIIGVLTAYYLTRHPKYSPVSDHITILEATDIASGASGKAGGLLALWAYPACIVPLSFQLHAQLAEEHGGESRWGYRRVTASSVRFRVDYAAVAARKTKRADFSKQQKKNPDDLGDVHGYEAIREHGEQVSDQAVQHGQESARDEWQGLEKVKDGKMRTKRGHIVLPQDLDWLDEDLVQGYNEMGDQSETAQVHPYLFTKAMAELAVAAGVKVIYAHVDEVTKEIDGGRCSVLYTARDTNQTAQLSASEVIITAGPWTSKILPSCPVDAVRAHSIVIEEKVSPYAIFTDISLPPSQSTTKSRRHANTVTPEMYARPDGTIYACGEADGLVPLPRRTADVQVDESRCDELSTYLALVAPSLGHAKITAKQACYLPTIASGEGPMIGETKRKGIYVASGHTCWGIQNSCATGKLMSEIIYDGRAVSANVADLHPSNWGV